MVMTRIGDMILSSSAAATNAAWRSRALKKTSDTSGLRGEERDAAQQQSPYPPKETPSPLPQSGTPKPVPFQDTRRAQSLRLTAAFTAQLLGQIRPDPERRAAAGAAYERPAMKLSLGLDTKL
jgi:hypothetical protein